MDIKKVMDSKIEDKTILSESSSSEDENKPITPVKRGVGKRGKNKSKYHFCVYDGDEDKVRYYCTIRDIQETYKMCRSTVHNMLKGKRSKKYPNIKIERDHKPVIQIDLDLSNEDMAKYFPNKL